MGLFIASQMLADDCPAPKPDSKKSTAATDEYQAIETEASAAHQRFIQLYREAKRDEEREVMEDYDAQLDRFAERMLKLAKGHPNDPAAVDALSWVVRNVYGKQADEALEALTDRADSDKLAPVCETFARMGGLTPKTERLLRAVMEKNRHHRVQGIACLALAQSLKQTSAWGESKDQTPYAQIPSEKLSAEAEQLFERVISEFGDVKSSRGPLEDTAKSELYEMRHLAIGMVAPEIEGEDLDGQPLKLSEYRSKVVLLDFWGHW